jgi:uncharacterized OB-fold protein
MSENRARVVAEYCPSCGEVHFPPPGMEGTGMVCTTCRYQQTHDRRQVSDSLSEEGRRP